MWALKPQDLVVSAKLLVMEGAWTYSQVAGSIGLSPSEVHAAVQRARGVHLLEERVLGIADQAYASRHGIDLSAGTTTTFVNGANFLEFALHGLRFVFPAAGGAVVRGLPTAHAAPGLKSHFTQTRIRPVWPDPEGPIQGETLEPLYPSVPKAAKNDPELYTVLALLDLLRAGGAREREVAGKLLRQRVERGPLP